MNYNSILNRTEFEQQIKQILSNFERDCDKPSYKKGIFIHGQPGIGKTHFITNILNEINYNVIYYDAGDVRNKMMIESITSSHISSYNVLDMMKGIKRRKAIVMDDIDGMNSGDKCGINSLIKLIRQKKTAKQKTEIRSNNPIICIGTNCTEKKIVELMKVCYVFELKTPTTEQINQILIANKITPTQQISNYVQGDLRKLNFVIRIQNEAEPESITAIFNLKRHNDTQKQIVRHLLNNHVSFNEHTDLINETDQTTVGLLWHENVIDAIEKNIRGRGAPERRRTLYMSILEQMCFADYIDRIKFQQQLWQFNEPSSLIKTVSTNNMFHNAVKIKPSDGEVRFTKVLTKFSTEHNNSNFIFSMCQRFDLDRHDLFSFFKKVKEHVLNKVMIIGSGRPLTIEEQTLIGSELIITLMDNNETYQRLAEDYGVKMLDMKRMYRYMDRNMKVKETEEEEEDDDYLDEATF